MGAIPDTSGSSFSNHHISGLNFDSKKFVEEEFNKSKYLTLAPASPIPKRLSLLSPELKSRLKAQSIRSSIKRWGSTFLSNMEQNDLTAEEDFSNTLNLIIKRNVDFWQDFSKKKGEVEASALNKMIEKRQNLKRKILGKLILPEKRNVKKGYIDLMDTVASMSTNVPNSKLVSAEAH